MNSKDKNKRIAERFIEQSRSMHFEHTEERTENKERKYKIVDSLGELVGFNESVLREE